MRWRNTHRHAPGVGVPEANAKGALIKPSSLGYQNGEMVPQAKTA